MNSETITLILGIAVIISYIVYIAMRIRENNSAPAEDSRIDKLIEVMREYAKDHADLREYLKRAGML